MHKYTDLTGTEPKYQGGFIWDYIDQSIYKKDRYGKEFQPTAETSASVLLTTISAATELPTAAIVMRLRRCRK